MSSDLVGLEPAEARVGEILDRLESGDRILLDREMLGPVHEITLRFDGKTYYCDTPATLHRHETAEGMRRCLNEQAYGTE